jgi:uncharacterized protein
MSYRWADHQIFDAPGGAILFGVDHASLFRIDEQTRQVFCRWRARERIEESEVPPADWEILRELREIMILVPAGTEREPRRFAVDPSDIPLETMVLEVAQDCNLRCTYCYAEGGTYGNQPRLLDPAAARQAVRLLIDGSGDRPTVTLILFGGEPLLNMPAVTAAVEEAEARGAEAGKRVVVSLTTNGTLLTPAICDFIRRHRLAVAVSMDGPPDLHDGNRADPQGNGSYLQILSRLGGLLAESRSPVAARVTLIPRQWARVEEVFDHLTGLGFHEVGIAPASPVRRELLPDPAQEEELFQGFAALARRFVQTAGRATVLPFSNLIDLLARLHEGQTKSVACGAGFGYLAVDAGGSFYLCHRFTGEESFRAGDLERGPSPEKIRAALESVTAGRAGMCAGCWARTLCGGGCHYENHLRETCLGLPPGSSCAFIRRWLQLGIEVYGELRSSGADGLLRMLEKRAKC